VRLVGNLVCLKRFKNAIIFNGVNTQMRHGAVTVSGGGNFQLKFPMSSEDFQAGQFRDNNRKSSPWFGGSSRKCLTPELSVSSAAVAAKSSHL
jgi:hypothetical protein